ncbi:zn 2cys6 transcription factor [Diplodia corticola]|uniref:Zn 2cys6 transcription factor n=1 Tax=Diplodia corticola TaxID=236234 RepID=A0A1J9S1Y3_9PEZI|nr:zn 2cys6 transcription factor [Diplodia corticola]OJD33661.1 zn 2cys6 transcription factor [Diplodia corticola]
MDVDTRESRAKSSKQAACIACRRTKTKCLRDPGAAVCKKCRQKGSDCVIPSHHVGRQKGTKNKRTGLAKAIFQVEQAVAQLQSGRTDPQTNDAALHLEHLLDQVRHLPQPDRNDAHSTAEAYSPSNPSSSDSPTPVTAVADYPLNDAENPLQLLAHASDLSRLRLNPGPYQDVDQSSESVLAFFSPLRPKLDVSSDADPIELGLVTQAEADDLFQYFFEHLTHTRWGMDRYVHSLPFVRARSSFLLTSILAASALFIPSAEALSKRLSAHCRKLAHAAMVGRYRSVEVVLAFMVNVPWLSFGEHWADDETCSYLSAALTVAMDLALHKIVTPSPNNVPDASLQGYTGSDTLDAKKALYLDGFDNVDPASMLGRRLLRRRERTWLSLFVLDRGVCLARGRVPVVPKTSLVERCDAWHISDIADIWDSSIISVAVMRRDLDVLIKNIRECCDMFVPEVTSSSESVQRIKAMIDGFFEQWHRIWAYAQQPGYRLPPYVQILVSHTRLSLYSSVVNHPTAPAEVRRFFRAAGLSSALHVMRAALHGEKELASMPNNTAIMVAFAACFTLRLHSLGAGFSASLAPSVRQLIEETAGALERIGTTPRHREGVSAILGRYLRAMLGRSISTMPAQRQKHRPSVSEAALPVTADAIPGPQFPPVASWAGEATITPQPLLFSTMSDIEIDQAIQNDQNALQPFDLNLPVAYASNLDWMDWLDWAG